MVPLNHQFVVLRTSRTLACAGRNNQVKGVLTVGWLDDERRHRPREGDADLFAVHVPKRLHHVSGVYPIPQL